MLTWRWFLRCLLGSSLLFLAPADSRPPRIDIDKNVRRMLQSAAADKNVRSMLQSVGRLAGSSYHDQSANDHLKRQHLQHLLRQALTFLDAAATTPLPKLDKDDQNRLSDKDFDDLLGETTGEYFNNLLYDTSDDEIETTDGVTTPEPGSSSLATDSPTTTKTTTTTSPPTKTTSLPTTTTTITAKTTTTAILSNTSSNYFNHLLYDTSDDDTGTTDGVTTPEPGSSSLATDSPTTTATTPPPTTTTTTTTTTTPTTTTTTPPPTTTTTTTTTPTATTTRTTTPPTEIPSNMTSLEQEKTENGIKVTVTYKKDMDTQTGIGPLIRVVTNGWKFEPSKTEEQTEERTKERVFDRTFQFTVPLERVGSIFTLVFGNEVQSLVLQPKGNSMDRLMGHLVFLHEKIKMLRSDRRDSSAVVAGEVNGRIDDLQGQLTNLKEMEKQHSALIGSLQTKTNRLETELNKAATKDDLEALKIEQNNKLDLLDESLKNDIEELEESIKAAKTELQLNIDNGIKNATGEIDELKSEIATLKNDQQESQKKEVEALQLRVESLEDQIEELRKLNETVNNNNKDIELMKGKIKSNEEKIDLEIGKVEEITGRVDDIEIKQGQDVAMLQKEIEENNKQYAASLMAVNDELGGRIGDVANDVSGLDAALTEKINTLNATGLGTLAEVEQLKGDLAAVTGSGGELAALNATLNLHRQENIDMINENKLELAQFKNRTDTTVKEIRLEVGKIGEGLNNTKAQFDSRLGSLEATVDAGAKERKKLDDRLQVVEGKISTDLLLRIEALESRMNAVEDKLTTTTTRAPPTTPSRPTTTAKPGAGPGDSDGE